MLPSFKKNMNSAWPFLTALAVLRATATPQTNNSFRSNNFKIIKSDCESSVPPVKTHIRASVVENPTLIFPSFIPPATISQSCRCLRTIVQPHIIKEIITAPTLDKILHAIAAPTVEIVETPLGTFTRNSIPSGVSGHKNNLGGVFQNDISTLSGCNNRLSGEENARSFSTRHSSNSANGGSLNKSDKGSGSVISQPTVSAFLNMNDRNYRGPTSIIFSGDSAYLDNEHILGFKHHRKRIKHC